MVPLMYHIRSLIERKRTTVATALGIALVVFVLSASMMLNAGIEEAMGLSGRNDVAVMLRKGSDAELGSSIDTEQVPLILAMAGVARTPEGEPIGVGELVVVATMARTNDPNQIANAQLRGVPESYRRFYRGLRLVEGRWPTPGTDEVMVGKKLRGNFVGMDLGQSFELKKNRPAHVVGVFEDGGSSRESEVWVDIDVLRSAFGRTGIVSSVRVVLSSAGAYAAFAETATHDKRLGLEVFRETAFLEKQSEGTKMFLMAVAGVTSFFFSIGAVIGAMITMFSTIAQRQREMGVFRALGFSKNSILMAFLFEASVLALVGGVLGALASLGLGFVHFSTMNFATWSEIVFRFRPDATVILKALCGALAMGLIGGFIPAFKASRISPMEAMRN
jgi:putative ABC transport system permease protein